jgi:ubiquinone/menaquinone biosynthesis C-methylase UbiE
MFYKMTVQEAYNQWAETYDTMPNKTRDLEGIALRSVLADCQVEKALEIGCGTGKNTIWLQNKAKHLVAADFSEEMMKLSAEKIMSEYITFQQMDLRFAWPFESNTFNLITCSLTLEHIENLDFIFQEANRVLKTDGVFYIGEFHPFKQYLGSKARFETGNGTFELECYVHHVTEFYAAAAKNKLTCVDLKEWFDADSTEGIPRILSMLFRKLD